MIVGKDFRGEASQREIARDDTTCEALVEQGTKPGVPNAKRSVYASRGLINYSRWEDAANIDLAAIKTYMQWSYSATAVHNPVSWFDTEGHFSPTGWGTWFGHGIYGWANANEARAWSAAQFEGAQYFPACAGSKVHAWFYENRVRGFQGGAGEVYTNTELTGAWCKTLMHFSRDIQY